VVRYFKTAITRNSAETHIVGHRKSVVLVGSHSATFAVEHKVGASGK
jgi:hypothetical protein